MKYKISHLFVKLTNLFQSKIVTTKVNKKNNKIFFFFVFYYCCDSHATKDFTRFHWIIHDHVIHELYCHKNIYRGSDVATCVQSTFYAAIYNGRYGRVCNLPTCKK
jgi:hypothetical protein